MGLLPLFLYVPMLCRLPDDNSVCVSESWLQLNWGERGDRHRTLNTMSDSVVNSATFIRLWDLFVWVRLPACRTVNTV